MQIKLGSLSLSIGRAAPATTAAPIPRPYAGSGPYGDSGYEVAQLFSRFHKHVMSCVGSEDDELSWSQRKQLLTHTYQLARFYPYTYSAASKLARYVVGDGVWPTPKTSSVEWNALAAQKFKAHWDDPRLCDVRNRQSLTDILKHLVPHVLLFAGDAGLRMLPGMRLNPYESDRIGPPNGQPPPADEVQGVRYDIAGELTGYRVGRRASGGVDASEVVPSADFIFVPRLLKHRFDQVRGVGALPQAFSRLINAGEITTAELRAMLAASKVAFYMPIDGLEEIEVRRDADGNPIYPKFQLADGSILYGPPGHDPKSFKHDRPNENFVAAMRMVWTEVASVLEMSYELLTGDFTKANHSIFRGIRMEDQASIGEIQGWLRRLVLDRLFFWSTSYWVKRKELPPPPKDFEGDAANYLVSWSFPKLEHIDPYKEEQSNRLRLENGGTLRSIYGDRWEETLKEKANEMRRLKEIARDESRDGIEITPEELMRPISDDRTQEIGAAAEQIRQPQENAGTRE